MLYRLLQTLFDNFQRNFHPAKPVKTSTYEKIRFPHPKKTAIEQIFLKKERFVRIAGLYYLTFQERKVNFQFVE